MHLAAAQQSPEALWVATRIGIWDLNDFEEGLMWLMIMVINGY